MKLFQSIQRGLALVGLTSYQSRQKNPFSRKILITTFSYTLTVISFDVYLFCVARTFWEYTENIYTNSQLTVALFCYIIVVFKMKNIFQGFNECEIFTVKSLDYPESIPIYVEANERIEKCSEIIHVFAFKLTPICIIMPKVFVCMSNYFTTDLGNEALVLPLPMWIPFDTKNLAGYLFAVALEYASFLHICCIMANLVSIGIGASLFYFATTEDIKNNFKSINENAKAKATQLKIHQSVCHSIQVHFGAKQLIQNFNEEIRLLNLALYSWAFIAICCSMLLIQMELANPNIDVVVLFTAILYAVFAFGSILLSCEGGQRISNGFEEIEDVTAQYRWYLFPEQVKRMLPTILINLQVPVGLPIFGSFYCGRNTFKRVTKTGFSYFMVLRRFS